MDFEERQRALDPNDSFIVEAPAGSGKTELLTMRYLSLLCYVNRDPEEIVALTFTRKAAYEMKQRILSALKQAQEPLVEADSSPQIIQRHQLAQKVLQRDREKGWRLIENPNRLRVMTLDALCTMLAFRSPILSQFGGKPQIHHDPQSLYDQAVKAFILQTNQRDEWFAHFQALLLYFDNIDRLMSWLKGLLRTRDQWLPFLYQVADSATLEVLLQDTTQHIIQEAITPLAMQFRPHRHTICEILSFLSEQTDSIQAVNWLETIKETDQLPAQAQDLDFWLSLAELCLTKTGEWRKSVTIKQGFPSPSTTKDKHEKEQRKNIKQLFLHWLSELQDNSSLDKALFQLTWLPQLPLIEDELQVLSHLQALLPILTASLHLVFKECGQVDFIETGIGAQYALQDEIGATDLAFALDYKINHLLVDEFQDTSNMQFTLLSTLIREWRPDEGKSIFLVGDPQQSIYRFRGAEVGVFLHAQQYGIANIALETLTLKQNFRTKPAVLEWIGQSLKRVFPSRSNVTTGAVSYTKAYSAITHCPKANVFPHCFKHSVQEGQFIVDTFKKIKQEHPTASVAVLVRARAQLVDLLSLLTVSQVPFLAKDIKSIALLPHVIDYLSLIRALTNWHDRIAWLSVLRAPWLGLQLADIYTITQNEPASDLWQSVQQVDSLQSLSEDAKFRLKPFIEIIQYWYQNRQRKSIDQWYFSLWQALQGESCYPGVVKADIEQVTQLMMLFINQNGTLAFDSFYNRLLSVYVDQRQETASETIHPDEQPLQLMTIHQAKGLEFDYVFLPNLERANTVQDQPLLNWHEGWYGEEKRFVMGAKTIADIGSKQKTLYSYINKMEAQKERYEQIRLLYVAMTRAKSQLYLCYTLSENSSGVYEKPKSGSFLYLLADHLSLETISYTEVTALQTNQIIEQPFIYRKNQPAALPFCMKPEQQIMASTIESEHNALNRPERSPNHLRLAGTLFHRLVAVYAQSSNEQRTRMTPAHLFERTAFLLQRYGLSQTQEDQVKTLLHQAVDNIFADQRGRWIIDHTHQQRLTEQGYFSQYTKKANIPWRQYVLDCAFMDENKQWWIIDFKLTQEQDVEQIIKQENLQQYKQQLQNYQRILCGIVKKPVNIALYFPTIPYWMAEDQL